MDYHQALESYPPTREPLEKLAANCNWRFRIDGWLRCAGFVVTLAKQGINEHKNYNSG
jgi:hypothetical protein